MLTLTLDAVRRVLALGRRGIADADSGPFQATRPASGQPVHSSNLIFRLKAWPQLREPGRTAEIYRMLSVMSSQPVNRQWLLARFRVPPQQLDELLVQLVAQGCVEVIDPARFAGREPCRV
jgi:hypothetical protein